MNISVLYHSQTGNTKAMAEVIAEGAMRVHNIQAKCFSIDALDEVFVQSSHCVILGTPVYLASVSKEIKIWLEGPARKLKLAGKLGGAFATADYVHGGGELGIRTILDHMLVLGMLTYSGGGSYGKPVIHLGPVGLSKHLDITKDIFTVYGTRMAEKTAQISGALV